MDAPLSSAHPMAPRPRRRPLNAAGIFLAAAPGLYPHEKQRIFRFAADSAAPSAKAAARFLLFFEKILAYHGVAAEAASPARKTARGWEQTNQPTRLTAASPGLTPGGDLNLETL